MAIYERGFSLLFRSGPGRISKKVDKYSDVTFFFSAMTHPLSIFHGKKNIQLVSLAFQKKGLLYIARSLR
jgi:hypothetical protein